MRSKADYVISKNAILTKLLQSLEGLLEKLEDDCIKQFCNRHRSVPKGASHTQIWASVHAERTLQRALDTRNASRALYYWFLKANGETPNGIQSTDRKVVHRLKLDLALLAGSSNSDPQFSGLTYHFFVHWLQNGLEQELQVEGPVPPCKNTKSPEMQTNHTANSVSSSPNSTTIDFATACATILKKNAEQFSIGQEADPTESAVWFRSRSPVPNSAGKAKMVRLRELLESIQNKPSWEAFEDFPFVERLDLAYQVVECGLMFLGTSWLSDLRSAQLLRLKNYTKGLHNFILDLENESSSASATELLETVEPQTFMMGVLLTEIAIAQPVVGLMSYTSNGSRKISLRVTRINDQGVKQEYEMRLGSAIRQVRNHMDVLYSEAVEFCLRQPAQPSRNISWAQVRGCRTFDQYEEAYKDILNDFYEKVFIR